MRSRHPVFPALFALAFTLAACSGEIPTEAESTPQFAKGGKKGAGGSEPALASEDTPIQVYGSWHCGEDACLWGSQREITEFDQKNHWLIDRGDGSPSVNLVVLSFVNPLRLLNGTTDEITSGGVPRGMTREVVDYFRDAGVRVMLSIGGITYVDDWNVALATNPAQLGLNAATVAEYLGVGIEIDYEENANPDLAGLQAFIDAYRSKHPYDESGADPAARLTIDLAAGDRWLIALTRHATNHWLDPADPVLDYANAMVPNRQPGSADDAIANWYEHIEGKSRYDPPIPPLAPQMFTGSLYIVTGRKPAPECVDFASSLQDGTGEFVQRVVPNPDGPQSAPGMLGFMFWAAELPSPRRISTAPPNSCEGGVGVGATEFDIPVPMPPLRRE
ncbi:MAG: hypothetical protein P8049_10715 [Gemmatimonadota bacterium]